MKLKQCQNNSIFSIENFKLCLKNCEIFNLKFFKQSRNCLNKKRTFTYEFMVYN